jgi:4-hydroxybenzoate polyprenyltransferase
MPRVKTYLSLIKFSHTIFAMPFAMIGFFLGVKFLDENYMGDKRGWTNLNGVRQWNLNKTIGWEAGLGSSQLLALKFLFVVLCMIFARSAAMAFNRYLDRSFDAENPRTAIREIPSGILKANSVLIFTIISSILFIVCAYLINTLCFYLSPIALLIILGYSYTKRFTALCHLILGLGLSLAPIGAFLAVTGEFSLLPIIFSLAVIFWVSGFDIIYALQDAEFDKSQQLKSIPAWLGKVQALRVSEILHGLSAIAIILPGLTGFFGWLYWVGVAVFVGMLIYQHSLVKPNNLSRVNVAFMTANGIASVVFAVFLIADLYLVSFYK